MHDLSRSVLHNPLIGRIENLLPEDTYLVGGCVRDMLLGRAPLDLDIVTFSPLEEIANAIASRLNSRPFWMDEKRGVMRIAMKSDRGSIDVSIPKGKDIEEDLMSRDLTINAMAYEVASGMFLDPAGGIRDLEMGTVRIISERNLQDDPLRALRAVRFSVTLDFALHQDTSGMIRKNASLMRSASPERVKQEIIRALDSVHGSKFFRLLIWTGLIDIIFPREFTMHAEPQQIWNLVFNFALPISAEMDGILYASDALMPGSTTYLIQEKESRVTRMSLLRLTAFLLGLQEARMDRASTDEQVMKKEVEVFGDLAGSFCASLRFSSLSTRTVKTLLNKWDPIKELLCRDDVDALNLYRFCEGMAEYLPEALLLALAWAQGQNLVLRQTVAAVWEYYLHNYLEQKKAPLVTGRDVMQILKSPSGPEVGNYLRRIEEARAQGIVQTRNDALQYLHTIAS